MVITPLETTCGQRRPQQDGIPLNFVKQSNPIELAEYAILNHIDDEPAIKWWVPLVICKQNQMVYKVKKKYWQTTHKFEIRISKTVAKALQLHKENSNTYWADAITKEMSKAKVAYVLIEGVMPEEV